jgi:hypothetical protein
VLILANRRHYMPDRFLAQIEICTAILKNSLGVDAETARAALLVGVRHYIDREPTELAMLGMWVHVMERATGTDVLGADWKQ